MEHTHDTAAGPEGAPALARGTSYPGRQVPAGQVRVPQGRGGSLEASAVQDAGMPAALTVPAVLLRC